MTLFYVLFIAYIYLCSSVVFKKTRNAVIVWKVIGPSVGFYLLFGQFGVSAFVSFIHLITPLGRKNFNIAISVLQMSDLKISDV